MPIARLEDCYFFERPALVPRGLGGMARGAGAVGCAVGCPAPPPHHTEFLLPRLIVLLLFE